MLDVHHLPCQDGGERAEEHRVHGPAGPDPESHASFGYDGDRHPRSSSPGDGGKPGCVICHKKAGRGISPQVDGRATRHRGTVIPGAPLKDPCGILCQPGIITLDVAVTAELSPVKARDVAALPGDAGLAGRDRSPGEADCAGQTLA